MYSRNYGIIENGEKTGFALPPDYGGNAYRQAEKNTPPPPSPPPKEPPPPKEASPEAEEKKPPTALAGGFLERLTAEDILLFVFLYSLIRGNGEEGGEILGLVLALLLL